LQQRRQALRRKLADPVWQFMVGLVAVVGITLAAISIATSRPIVTSPQPSTTVVTAAPDRAAPPVINGTALRSPTGERPPVAVGWAGGGGAIPTNTWWSALSVGDGAPGLYPLPLAARVAPTGRTELAVPTRVDKPDGTVDSEFIPTIFAEFTSAPIVTGAGALHATWTYNTDGGTTSLTMMQGSPFLEFAGTGSINLTIPALRWPKAPSLRDGIDIGTSTGPWIVAGRNVSTTPSGDNLTVRFGEGGGSLVLAPALAQGAGTKVYKQHAVELAGSALTGSTESLSVDAAGFVKQTMEARRQGKSSTRIWSLDDRQLASLERAPAPSQVLGRHPSISGTRTLINAPQLVLRYNPVPLSWTPSPVTETGEPTTQFGLATAGLPPLTEVPRSSYFGGKAAATAALASLLSDDPGQAATNLEAATQLLRELIDQQSPPNIAWEERWGKAIIEPAEFGSLKDLNDHQLQYVYWVIAASIVAEKQPESLAWLTDAVDLLIADYGGTGVSGTTIDRYGTWSPFDGHSWASGIHGFAAGNNLESISESSAAWWAAARWYTVTGRPALAERFVAMLTIESHVTGDRWLPNRPPLDQSHRPWSGVVWAAKVDNTTWFDPSNEAALGIRLLPLGPMSFSRYHNDSTVSAAGRRWAWCDSLGGGCRTRWANLLDSDAVVAGRPKLDGPDPEASTTPAMVSWWRTVWQSTQPAFDVRCTPGLVARRPRAGTTPPNTVLLLASNPGPVERLAQCWSSDGRLSWSGALPPRSASSLIVNLSTPPPPKKSTAVPAKSPKAAKSTKAAKAAKIKVTKPASGK
jgi:endo-1,3(4)-beta-glucanase